MTTNLKLFSILYTGFGPCIECVFGCLGLGLSLIRVVIFEKSGEVSKKLSLFRLEPKSRSVVFIFSIHLFFAVRYVTEQ
jgi:hypothetical protein